VKHLRAVLLKTLVVFDSVNEEVFKRLDFFSAAVHDG
jgi:hypothetical protein